MATKSGTGFFSKEYHTPAWISKLVMCDVCMMCVSDGCVCWCMCAPPPHLLRHRSLWQHEQWGQALQGSQCLVLLSCSATALKQGKQAACGGMGVRCWVSDGGLASISKLKWDAE
jgi:hypothetical protein